MDFSQPLNFGDTATAWRRPKTGDSQQQLLVERQHREQMESAEKERRLALAEKEYERKREAEIELARQQNRRLSYGDSNPLPSNSSIDDRYVFKLCFFSFERQIMFVLVLFVAVTNHTRDHTHPILLALFPVRRVPL